MQDNKHGGDTQKCHINHGKNEQKKKPINSATIYKQKKQDGNQEQNTSKYIKIASHTQTRTHTNSEIKKIHKHANTNTCVS